MTAYFKTGKMGLPDAYLLEGIDLSKGRRRKRYALPAVLAEPRAELEAPKQ
jgi:hypothetical protein